MQVRFTDPATGATYDWAINPGYAGVTAPTQKQRNITRTSSTSNGAPTRQQGDDGPSLIRWEVEVFTEAHELQLWVWYQLCKTQTIYLRDWAGEECEGQIVVLGRQQVGVVRGPGDASERGMYAKYVFEFEIYRFISGVQFDAGMRVA